MPKSDLQDRIIYGVLAGVAALVVVSIGGILFYAAMIAVAILASLEFDKLRDDGKICFIYCAIPILAAHYFLLALALTLLAAIVILVQQHITKVTCPWLIVSVVYITLPVISLIWLRNQPNGFEVVFWLILVIVATDIGAYFAGKHYGKKPLAPKISPKKTWEGLSGGILCAVIVSGIYTLHFNLALLGIVLAILGQASDLLESRIKRHFNVKDTGNILPGHGGIMDRTDGLVLTSPLIALIYYYQGLAW